MERRKDTSTKTTFGFVFQYYPLKALFLLGPKAFRFHEPVLLGSHLQQNKELWWLEKPKKRRAKRRREEGEGEKQKRGENQGKNTEEERRRWRGKNRKGEKMRGRTQRRREEGEGWKNKKGEKMRGRTKMSREEGKGENRKGIEKEEECWEDDVGGENRKGQRRSVIWGMRAHFSGFLMAERHYKIDWPVTENRIFLEPAIVVISYWLTTAYVHSSVIGQWTCSLSRSFYWLIRLLYLLL